MAAATVASTSRQHELGDISSFFVSFTALADTNTYAVRPGLNVLGVIVLSASTSASITATWSGSTVTFTVSSGTPDATVLILTGTK